jgi:hypothetical protein
MKKSPLLFLSFACAFFSTNTFADSYYVNGYYKQNGTYVQGHQKTTPDEYRYNNRNAVSNGGYERDEYSISGATNKRNSQYGLYDNDRDGVNNSYDNQPEVKRYRY